MPPLPPFKTGDIVRWKSFLEDVDFYYGMFGKIVCGISGDKVENAMITGVTTGSDCRPGHRAL